MQDHVLNILIEPGSKWLASWCLYIQHIAFENMDTGQSVNFVKIHRPEQLSFGRSSVNLTTLDVLK